MDQGYPHLATPLRQRRVPNAGEREARASEAQSQSGKGKAMTTNVPVRLEDKSFEYLLSSLRIRFVQMKEFQSLNVMYGEIKTLFAGVQTLTAERDSLRADAQRYRWLRAKDSPSAEICLKARPDGAFVFLEGEKLDAAIDSAIAALPLHTPASGLKEQK
jgi:hypothetical protein